MRPATRTIRGQVESLEGEVARRTAELDQTLAALRREAAVRERVHEQSRRLAHPLAHADRVEFTGRLAAGLAQRLEG